MPSEIRDIIAEAQQAEIKGDKPRAISLLEQAAIYFKDKGLDTRALQVLRQARRLAGEDVSDEALMGFISQQHVAFTSMAVADPVAPASPASLEAPPELGEVQAPLRTQWQARAASPLPYPTPGGPRPLGAFDRGPQVSDPSVDAWCSFCCRPKREVGTLVSGPAGAYICATCASLSSRLLGDGLEADRKTTEDDLEPLDPSATLLPSQERAIKRLEARKPRIALVLGPEGAGKTALLRRLGRVTALPVERFKGDRVILDLDAALPPDVARRLLRWLDEHAARRAVIAVRAVAPAPVLVLQSEAGDEPVFDTASLATVVGPLLAQEVVARVDAVLALELPDHAALRELGRAVLEGRGATIPPAALDQLVALALRSGRGAHELAALVARIPAGRYQAP